MKYIKFLSLLILAAIGFTSCDQEDDLVFVAKVPEEGISFSNMFLEEYTLTTATSKNIGERFTWEDAYFGVPTNIEYELQNSLSGDFTDATVVATTDGNELSITIGNMLTYATAAGLDNDPNTDNPNSGELYFRLMASPGTDGGLPVYTETQTLNVVLPEAVTGGSAYEVSTWGVVGSGYNNWGAFADGKFYTTATPGVIVSYVNLVDGEIKFRENNTWSGDLGDANMDGILDADSDNNIAVTAGDYKITINTNDNSYTIEEFSWGIVGSGFNNWGNTPGVSDAKLYYDYTTDTFKASVKLFDGEIKFRMNNAWSVNFGDANLDGILDSDSDNNIAVTEGHYLITLDLKDNSYTIQESNTWGVVGSGYNNWGGDKWDHDGDTATAEEFISDAALTEIQPGVWFAENITLIDGLIKFRPDNAWNGDYGDANVDNILDQDPDNNIVVTAGNYVISIDFNDAEGPKYYLGKR
ncbi:MULTISPECIES: SusE domain-containing protein [Aestuariibaculum]|uniref:SusE domain-containing protein n=1 Tax=Aestuariibaculum lutulentum TaxID=2920935 RepID=A0ABS9RI92_9FLAO|nr:MULTISPECIES: SusE domain-containing protein [Aestuariibaculum]MCH4552663.1 SusE domain-containing protein [Aestuariibaculum lutulentum]MCR8668102.1 SusE domain-containing protein [Aestuariibaculum sp. M13]